MDEFNGLEMIEEFSFNGRCILSKGKNFFKHLDFVKQIRESYRKKMEIIESYSFDSSAARSDLFELRFGQEIDRKKLIPMIQSLKSEFKVYLVKLYEEVLYDYFKVIDLHTGQRLYMQVFDDRMYINLPKSVCGNNILRLKENLVRKFDDKIQLTIANQKIN